jgi:ribosomal protein L23
MSQKKMTPTIAKALAEKVRAELVARNKTAHAALEKKVESSKLLKELKLTISKITELENKKTELKKEIEETYSTKVSDVTISVYGQGPTVYIREHAFASVESIKDMVLIEDYMADGNQTPEEFINYIADKLSK